MPSLYLWRNSLQNRLHFWFVPCQFYWSHHQLCNVFTVIASGAFDIGFEAQSNQIKDYEIGICCFFRQRTQYLAARANTGWLRMRIMRPPNDFQRGSTIKSIQVCWSRTKKWIPSSSHWSIACFRHDIAHLWRETTITHSLSIYVPFSIINYT